MFLNVDETTDNCERHVVSFILRTREEIVLIESKFLGTPVNGQSLAEMCNDVIISRGIKNQLRYFITDNAEYCKKAFNSLKMVFQKLNWLGCWAHLIILCGNAWFNNFSITKRFVSLLNQIFEMNTGAGRKLRFVHFLKRNAVENVKAPITSTQTRWNSLLKATSYHAEVFDYYKPFFEKEILHCESESLDEVSQILKESSFELKLELLFIKGHAQNFISLIELLQVSNKPIGHQVYNAKDQFALFLDSGKCDVSFNPPIEKLLSNCTNSQLGLILEHFQDSFKTAKAKLDKHLESQRDTIQHFREIRIFDPRQKIFLCREISSYKTIAEFHCYSNDLLDEWTRYYNSVIIFEDFDLISFWDSKKDEFPLLSESAKNYLWTPPGAGDVERSFSFLNLIETPRRSQLSDESLLKNLLFCYFNREFLEI